MADVIRKATNRFTKGLVMDFSPENTKNELLTHALNATLLTFNGNELSLQNDMGNEHSCNVIVAYITSSLKRLEMPTHIVIQHYEGLRKVSVVQTEQIVTLDKGDIVSVIDHLTDADMARVDMALKVSLGLEVSA